MAVQKRRQSKGRSASRRAQWMKMDMPAYNKCPQCGEFRLSHRACPACGQYGKPGEGRQAITIKTKEKAAKAEKAS